MTPVKVVSRLANLSPEFCRSINRRASLYDMFLTELNEESYEPRNSVLPSCTCWGGRQTTNNGSDDEVHWKLPCSLLHYSIWCGCKCIKYLNCNRADMDDYFQECGRAGHDGIETTLSSLSILIALLVMSALQR